MAVAGIAMLVFGFNYLKGKSIFKKQTHIYAVYQDVIGLSVSNPVVINGLQIGRVENIDGGKDMRRIVVTVNLLKDVNIPNNSVAVINPNLLGSTSLEIQLGNATTYLKNNDTILTTSSSGAFDEALKAINPVLYEVKNAVKSLDTVLHSVTSILDTKTTSNLKNTIANLSTTTESFAVSAASIQQMLNTQSGALASSLNNMNTFTANLNTNNEKLNSILDNTKTASAKFAAIDLKSTLDTLNIAIQNFKESSEKINSKEGSIGLLLNDKTLYNNLEATTNKINILLDDIRVHPKRYVNFSVFGKKDKGNYLKSSLVDDTLTAVKK